MNWILKWWFCLLPALALGAGGPNPTPPSSGFGRQLMTAADGLGAQNLLGPTTPINVALSGVMPGTRGAGQKPLRGMDSFYALGGSMNIQVSDTWVSTNCAALKANGFWDAGYNTMIIEDSWWSYRDTNTWELVATTNFPNGISNTIYGLHTNGFKCMLGLDDNIHPHQNPATWRTTWGFQSNDIAYWKKCQADSMFYDTLGSLSNNGKSDDQRTREHLAYAYWINRLYPSLHYMDYLGGMTNTAEDPMGIRAEEHQFRPWQAQAFDTVAYWPEWHGTNNWKEICTHIDYAQKVAPSIRPGKFIYMNCLLPGAQNWAGYPHLGLTQLTFWSLFHSHLIMGSPIEHFNYAPTGLLMTNRWMLEIDEDPLRAMPTLIYTNGTGGEVWAELLADSSYAIAFLNRSMSASWSSPNVPLTSIAGWQASDPCAWVWDIWNRTNWTISGTISVPTMSTCSVVYLKLSGFRRPSTAARENTHYIRARDLTWALLTPTYLDKQSQSPDPYGSAEGASWTTTASYPNNIVKFTYQIPSWVRYGTFTFVYEMQTNQYHWFTNSFSACYYPGGTGAGNGNGAFWSDCDWRTFAINSQSNPANDQWVLVTNTVTLQWPYQYTPKFLFLQSTAGGFTEAAATRYLLSITSHFE